MNCVNSPDSNAGDRHGERSKVENKKKLFSKEQVRQYIRDGHLKDLSDVQAMLKDLFATAVQEMLEAEMDAHLGYAKYDTKSKDTDNARNGHGAKRTVQSELGDIEIALPRDRKGEFDPVVVQKRQKRMPSSRGSGHRSVCSRLQHPGYSRPSPSDLRRRDFADARVEPHGSPLASNSGVAESAPASRLRSGLPGCHSLQSA